MTTKAFFTFRDIFSYPYSSEMSRGLRRVVPAAAVTTHAKPHAQQQPPRGLEESALSWGSTVGLNVSSRCINAIRSHADGWNSCECS